MEYIKYNNKYYGSVSDLSGFELKLKTHFDNDENLTIEDHYFQFGLIAESNHYANRTLNKKCKSPTIEIFKDYFDIELTISVQIGRDENHELDWKVADKFDKFYWRITRAMEYNRPNWSYFYFWGNLVGALNSRQIDLDKFNLYFDVIPKQFILKQNLKLIQLFNHFNELDLNIRIDNENKPSYNKRRGR